MTKKTKEELIQLAEALEARKNLVKFSKIKHVYPEKGSFSRDKYSKQMIFYRAGKWHRFRALMGGNRSGKSMGGGIELVYHLTGEYPEWWEGRRQKAPKMWIIVCETNALWMASLQQTLFGPSGDDVGTGLLPLAEKNNGVGLVKWGALTGTTGGIGTFQVRHKKGHVVNVYIKTYEMNREQFQAMNLDGIFFDEEPPIHLWTECIMRLMGTGNKEPGIVMLLFTPAKGLTEVIKKFLPNGRIPEDGVNPENTSYHSTFVSWEDVPHLSEEEKEELKASLTADELEARTQGIPGMGKGLVFPINEKFIISSPIKIPSHWPRVYGLDFGWDPTSAVWLTKDPNTGIYYVYAEYKQGKQAVYVHVNAIKSRGDWIPGLCDPSEGLVNYNDGTHQMEEYVKLGLNLNPSDPGILSGLSKLLNAFQSGTLKIVGATCTKLLDEIRVYHYDENNPNMPTRNQQDHLIDALKYAFVMFDYYAKSEDQIEDELYNNNPIMPSSMGRNSITGY